MELLCMYTLLGFGYVNLWSTVEGCMHHFRKPDTGYFFRVLFGEMPKYAVAKGKNTGIYDTWAECQEQVKGFNGAKFKKFSTQNEAENYMKKFGMVINELQENPVVPSFESKEAHNAFPVAKVSPSNTLLNDFNNRLSTVEAKLSNLIDHVTNAFSDIKQRLLALEGKSSVSNQLLELERKDADIAATSNRRGRKRRASATTSSNSSEDVTAENVGDENRQDDGTEKIDSLPKVKSTKLAKCKIVDEVDGNYGINQSVVNGRGFLISPFGAVVVYTDGACSNNGKRNAKAGIGVWFNDKHPLNMAAPVRGRATNNNAEIQAATAAILQAAKADIRHLHIFTDSQFLINCITSWIYKWKRNNWQTVEGKPVINKVELIELDECIATHMESVIWTYVKGHSNDVGNTSADELARQGASLYNYMEIG